MKIITKKLHEGDKEDDNPKTAEERLDLVEQLKIQSGKFLYEYPAKLRRIISVARTK